MDCYRLSCVLVSLIYLCVSKKYIKIYILHLMLISLLHFQIDELHKHTPVANSLMS
jgi:hypothetical protein